MTNDSPWFGLDDPQNVLAVLRDQLWTWVHASDLQFNRLQAASKKHHDAGSTSGSGARVWTEMAFLLYSVRNALKFARAIGHSDALSAEQRTKVTALVDACYASIPGIRNARDWVEHLEDQIRGRGRPPAPSPTDLGEFAVSNTTGALFGFRIGGVMVEPARINAAVQDLGREVLAIANEDPS